MVYMNLSGENGIKSLMSRLKLAIDKSNINPKSSWIEFHVLKEDCNSTIMTMCVSNFDYCLEVSLVVRSDKEFSATISAESFIPLISKLDTEEIMMDTNFNSLIVKTNESEYNFPLIKEMGRTVTVDRIVFDSVSPSYATISGSSLGRIAEINTKGLADASIKRDFQQFVCMDNRGCITFTDNIIINDFPIDVEDSCDSIKILLNDYQAKLLRVFESFDKVSVGIGSDVSKMFVAYTSQDIRLILTMILQEEDVTSRFPSVKLRAMADNVSDVHAVVDYKKFKKALERLMIFDKKFDITVLNYSKLVFYDDRVELISIKNKNKEIIKYDSGMNTSSHESMIRFADLLQQVKDIKSNTIDISYGNSKAVIINSNGIKIMIPEIQ